VAKLRLCGFLKKKEVSISLLILKEIGGYLGVDANMILPI